MRKFISCFRKEVFMSRLTDIKAKINVEIVKVTKTFTVTCIEVEFNGDKWGWKHRSLNKEVIK